MPQDVLEHRIRFLVSSSYLIVLMRLGDPVKEQFLGYSRELNPVALDSGQTRLSLCHTGGKQLTLL